MVLHFLGSESGLLRHGAEMWIFRTVPLLAIHQLKVSNAGQAL